MEPQRTMSGHILLMSFPLWGHTKSLLSFACVLVKEWPDISVTFLTAGDITPRLEREVSSYFSDENSRAKANIKIFNLGGEGTNAFALRDGYFSDFSGFYDKVLKGEPTRCAATQKTYVFSKPNAVVLDTFLLGVLQTVRSVTGKSIPTYCFDPFFCFASFHSFGPEKLGCYGNVLTRARIQVEATGGKMEDIVDEIYHPHSGAVIKVPGLPPIYDYELYPQEELPELVTMESQLWSSAETVFNGCDGIISTSNMAFERESIDVMRGWLDETNRPLYVVGPLTPPGFKNSKLSDAAKTKEIEGSKDGKDIIAFLDKTLKSHGKHSLIYVSFGSLWWPPKGEQVWLLVDALLELEFPFILAHASPRAVIAPEYRDKIRESKIGLLTAWSPQQAILSHPATGWQLSHCGQNSVCETLSQGIPIIAWPVRAEQGLNVPYLALTLDVAFEVVEVRTGHALQPLYRGQRPTGSVEAIDAELRDIIKRARGEEGERKRRNAQAIRDQWREGLEKGEGLKEMRRFLSDTCGGTAGGGHN